ncbi:hypothetical protein PSFL111601_13820 [Pseudomonas floridensis]
MQLERPIAAQYALIVVHGPGNVQTQTVFAVNTASTGVGQLPQCQLYILLSGNRSGVLVVQRVRSQLQNTVGQKAATAAVVEPANRGRQVAQAGNLRRAVVQRGSTEQ